MCNGFRFPRTTRFNQQLGNYKLIQIITSVLPNIGYQLNQRIIDLKLDPFTGPVVGNKSSNLDIKVCKGKSAYNYSVSDVHGLSGLNLDKLELLSLNQDGLNQEGVLLVSLQPIDISNYISAKAEISCGRFHPHAGISGNVTGNGLQIEVKAKVVGSISLMTLSSLQFQSVSTNFRRVYFKLDGKRNRFLNPIISLFLPALELSFKSKITNFLNVLLKKKFQGIADDKLPFTVGS